MDPRELNAQLEKLYHSAEAASSEGLADEAIKRCEAAIDLLDSNFDEECQFNVADFLMVAGHACWEDGDLESALRYYRQASEADPGRLDAAVALGVSLFHLCRFGASQQVLEMVSVEDPEIGEVWYYLALLALRRRQNNLADVFFARAHEFEPERWLIPKFLNVEEIEKILNELLNEFPDELKVALKNVAIVLDEQPSEELLFANDPPFDPLLLGLFEGLPLPEQSSGTPETDVPRVTIFSENIALVAEDEAKLREELAITLKHEIGHYLGLDEDDLAARGLD